LHSSISFSAYVPPAPKKKAKVERTRFRESTHTFREKSGAAAPPAAVPNEASAAPAPPATTPTPATNKKKKGNKKEEAATQKPGKKEKIRFGQAPRETLPSATANSATENAGALPETASNADQPANPLEPTAPTQKTRFSARARQPKTAKTAGNAGQAGATGPAPPNASEVADQQTQNCVKLLGRMKDIYIADLMGFDEGKLFDGFFLVLAKQQRTTKTNKPYLNLILGDKTGQIEAACGSLGDPRIAKDFDRGDMVKVRGSASRFDDRAADEGRSAAQGAGGRSGHKDMLPAPPRCGRAVAQLEASFVESVTNPDLKRLLNALLADRPRAGLSRGAGRAATASRLAGRLLEHVVSLLGLADRVAAHYPDARPRPAAVTGVILHDIGKDPRTELGDRLRLHRRRRAAGAHPDGRRAGGEDDRQPARLSPTGCARWCCT
jgi:hypothetical protein